MEAIGLPELTEMTWGEAMPPWVPAHATTSERRDVPLGPLARLACAGAAAFFMTVSTGHSGVGARGAPPRTAGAPPFVAATPTQARPLAPLAKTTLDQAWQSAVTLLEANGEHVHELTAGAASRVNGWRAVGVAAFPDTDDSDEG